jgi:hypothetical protein
MTNMTENNNNWYSWTAPLKPKNLYILHKKYLSWYADDSYFVIRIFHLPHGWLKIIMEKRLLREYSDGYDFTPSITVCQEMHLKSGCL